MATPLYPARLSVALLAMIGVCACDQYQRFGENGDHLGPVDPVNFPTANLGTRGDRLRPGLGSFTEAKAWVNGELAPYFAYPVPASMLAATGNPLLLQIDGKPNPRLPVTNAYAFEPNCQAPAGYRWTERNAKALLQRDGIRLDQQGNIFTSLPRATYTLGVDANASVTYVPVVNELGASAAGQPCQGLKSEEELKKAKLAGKATGRLMAWLIIDPAAAVNRHDMSNAGGIGVQKWGWFNRYLLAYLDGGEIPTMERTVMVGMAEQTQVLMRPRRLYYPRSMVSITTKNPKTGEKSMSPFAPGRVSAGYDIVLAGLGTDGYSPICQVFSYDFGANAVPFDDDSPDGYMGARLPNSAAAVEQLVGTPEMPSPMAMMMGRELRPASPAYVYCLQVQ